MIGEMSDLMVKYHSPFGGDAKFNSSGTSGNIVNLPATLPLIASTRNSQRTP